MRDSAFRGAVWVMCVCLGPLVTERCWGQVRHFEVNVGHAEKQAEARIRDALSNPTSVKLVQTPLTEWVELLCQEGVPTQIDRRALEEVGIDADDLLDLCVEGVTLRSALNMALEPLELTWTIRNESLTITTVESAELEPKLRLYDVSCLVSQKADQADSAGFSTDCLVEALVTCVGPESWEEVGGTGTVAVLSSSRATILSVAQTDRMHNRIAAYLEALAQATHTAGDGDAHGHEHGHTREADRAGDDDPFGGGDGVASETP